MRARQMTISIANRPDYGQVEVPEKFKMQEAIYIFGFQQGFFGDKAKRRTNFNSLKSSEAFNEGFKAGTYLRRNGRSDKE